MTKILTRVLSLGAGVQSGTILRMSIRGELPKLDYAIFADTGWESRAVYSQFSDLRAEAEGAGIPVIHLAERNIKDDALQSQVGQDKSAGARCASMPYFTMMPGAKREGRIRRQCSKEYKVEPIERWLRRVLLKLKPRQHAPKHAVIEQWIGISTDEPKRLKPSRNKWSIFRYPLVQDVEMSRNDCIRWLAENGYAPLERSACLGCPFRSDAEWRRMRDGSPDEFAEVVAFDAAIRHTGGMRADVFIHRKCLPLAEAIKEKSCQKK